MEPMGLCSGDDLGPQMALSHARHAGMDAQKENVNLRAEIELLKARLDKLEACSRGLPRLPYGT